MICSRVLRSAKWCLILGNLFSCFLTYALDKHEISVEMSPSGHFDYYVYALTWQPSYCTIHNIKPCPNMFKVHGVWPYFKTPSKSKVVNYHPSHCYRSPGCQQFEDCTINERTIQFVQKDQNLMRLLPDNSSGLLKHEWKKHGTCSGLTQIDYFRLFSQFENGLQYHRLEDKIKSRKGLPLCKQEVLSLLPGNTSLWCKHYQGKDYLFEIHFFIDKEGRATDDKRLQIGEPCPDRFIAPLY